MADAPVLKIQASYADMPNSHKRTFWIGGSPENYREIINWLRAICCSEGSVFKGIPSLNSGEYPFVEIKVVNPNKDSVKFIICKKDLFMIAFTSRSSVISRLRKSHKATNTSGVYSEDSLAFASSSQVIPKIKRSAKIASSSSEVIPESKRSDEATNSSSSGVDLKDKIALKTNSDPKTWFLFNCDYQIGDWEVLENYKGEYFGGTPPKDIGPCSMSGAVCAFNEVNATQDKVVHACQVFFVHLSEAARFRPVEYMVYNSLARTVSWREVPTSKEYEREEVERLKRDSGINNDKEEENCILVEGVGVEKDIYSLIKATGHVHPCFRVENKDRGWEEYLTKLVHSYDDLSKIWYTYYLSNKEMFAMESHHQPMLSTLRMRYRKSVRFTVAVLCRLNDRKLLPVLKKKVSDEQYGRIEAEIAKLRIAKKI